MSKKTEISEEPIEKQFIRDKLKEEDTPPIFNRPPNKAQDDFFFKQLQKMYHPLKLVRIKEGTYVKYKVEETDKVVFTDRTPH